MGPINGAGHIRMVFACINDEIAYENALERFCRALRERRNKRRVNKKNDLENEQINELAASLKQYSIDCRRQDRHRFAEVRHPMK